MTRVFDRLSPTTVKAKDLAPGRYPDGGNLYLNVGREGQRRWTFLYKDRATRRPREMGLGSAGKAGVSLADARRKAAAARALLADGIDPLTDKRSRRAAVSEPFGTYADRYIKNVVEKEAKNGKHVGQWRMTLEEYAKTLRSKPLDQISTEDVLACLRPIWDSKRETASRLRGRIARILDAAKVDKLRSGDNPAAWAGHLDNLLPKNREKAANHKAIPYPKLPAFMADLRKRNSISASALEFTVLCVARTGETIGARWQEYDPDRKLWVVPSSRMKEKKEHRVPLSDRAIEILESLRTVNTKSTDFLFPGSKRGKPLSNMAMLELVRGMYEGVTVHGFRSGFSDWCGETTSYDAETREFCLAHVVGDKAEAAYRRGDALEKRRAALRDWAEYLSG
ncbi:tyrosine-type recombinase/integrase (plasmid) [Bradyrhizobium barranii subsp. barranii]|uniref:Tyrosine-type recombinase/integrase n=1 Tax=Bradyrhizobium barranii subsp. barranii TaxID=2823807 RepID=A0A7Z0QLT4_9BRAD|nr:site-specific integrase [Bradyrhizobium barranii]UGX89855.1 tyrosine-type recombinase/integrase [Bradyrhizobium barranii subsp. barranii]